MAADAEDEEEETGESEEGSGVRYLTELERLSYNVSAIDNDTSVVPRGAFMRNAANDLVRDTTFKGRSMYFFRMRQMLLVFLKKDNDLGLFCS